MKGTNNRRACRRHAYPDPKGKYTGYLKSGDMNPPQLNKYVSYITYPSAWSTIPQLNIIHFKNVLRIDICTVLRIANLYIIQFKKVLRIAICTENSLFLYYSIWESAENSYSYHTENSLSQYYWVGEVCWVNVFTNRRTACNPLDKWFQKYDGHDWAKVGVRLVLDRGIQIEVDPLGGGKAGPQRNRI